jgi:multidrug efflux system outer membrane protein
MKAWIGATCCACVVSGCAVTTPLPLAEPLAAVPSRWSSFDSKASAEVPSLSLWWRRFDDRMLSDLIDQALQHNTSVNTAMAALRQARALRVVATAALWPSLDASASAQRVQRGSGATTAGGEGTSNVFQAGLDAAWELDVFGANRSAVTASTEVARASQASLGDIQVSIAAEVALNYIGLRALQTRLRIAQDNLASQLDTLQITQWRMQAGLGTALDVAQSRTLAEQTSALVPALQTSLAQTSHAVAVLVGQAPGALLDVLRPPGPALRISDLAAVSLPAATLRQRADVRAAEHQVKAALARIDQAQAARWPGFAISGSLGLSALTLGALTHGASVVNTLVGSVNVPLFDGGGLRAQVEVQTAAYEQARIAYQATVLTALKDVEDAIVAMQGDHLKLAHLVLASEAAGSAAQLAMQRYRSGLIDFSVVLETQRTQLGTMDNVATAHADAASDQVRLYKALGGGWASIEGQATP